MTPPRVKCAPDGSLWVWDDVDDRWFRWSPDGEFYGSQFDRENDGLPGEMPEWPEAQWPPSTAQGA